MLELSFDLLTGLGVFIIWNNLEKLQTQIKINNKLKKLLDTCVLYPPDHSTSKMKNKIDFDSRKLGKKEEEGVGIIYSVGSPETPLYRRPYQAAFKGFHVCP